MFKELLPFIRGLAGGAVIYGILSPTCAIPDYRAMERKARHPDVVFILGGPGAGKGTVCSKLEKDYGFVHLSAGDLLREERNRKGGEYTDVINTCIEEGKIVPVEVTVGLLKNAMDKAHKTRYLIDGFPRNLDNVQGWDKIMGNDTLLKFVMHLDCDAETMEQRCLSRATEQGRSDDNIETIRKRYDTYVNSTRPIIDMYESKHLVEKIDANQSADRVYKQVKKVLSEYY